MSKLISFISSFHILFFKKSGNEASLVCGAGDGSGGGKRPCLRPGKRPGYTPGIVL